MANNDSTTVTNLEATPSVVGSSSFMYGKVRVLSETFEVAAADNDGDTYTFFPVPLDCSVLDLEVVNDAITGGTDYDFGFYKITDNDLGAAIDADILMDGQTMASARAAWTSVLFAGTNAKDQGAVTTKLWADLGYASLEAAHIAAKNNHVYLVMTANTVGSATGTVSAKLTIGVE